MSRHAAIELAFADGVYTFRLGLGELEELEGKCDAGIFVLAGKLAGATRLATSREISETLRIGLIGGGAKPVDALALVKRYVDARPLDESRDTAYAVALAALARVHPDEKRPPDRGEAKAAKSSASTSPLSGQAQRSSGSRPRATSRSASGTRSPAVGKKRKATVR